jgi:CMP/dCMP kinase
MIITIDGPTASGKTTAGRLLAKNRDIYYLYSGLLYRALAYLLITHEVYQDDDLRNPKQEDLVRYTDPQRFLYKYDDQSQEQVFFDGQDITHFLKTSFIDHAASVLSASKQVRILLTNIQRKIAQSFDLVVDGRDTGSYVFPQADYKFFITASVDVRAQRWQRQQATLGNEFSLYEAIEQIMLRDRRDSTRAVAPLIIPEDAFVINNDNLNPKQTVEKMLTYIARSEQE